MTDRGAPLNKFLLLGCLFLQLHIQHAKFSASWSSGAVRVNMFARNSLYTRSFRAANDAARLR